MGGACEHHHSTTGLSGAGLAAALAAAEAGCAEAGERMTAPRRRVLELLLTSGEPVKAYDLIAAYNENAEGAGVAKPPTVYRALDFLAKQGLAHRIASISAYVACVHADAEHSAAFLICDCCGATREVAMPRSGLEASARAADFELGALTVEGHGRCAACRAAPT